MKHYVYIIYSREIDKFYTGESVDPIERVVQHNNGFYSNSSTKITNDWEIFLTIKCTSRTQAIKVERFIKKMRNRKFYHRLKNGPGIVVAILKRFSG